jgi:diguanylate cyclase (GGDEF)-like protein
MRSSAWLRLLLGMGVVAGAFVLAPRGLVQDVIWQVGVTGGAVAVLVGLRRHRPTNRRPWLVLAGSLLTFALGSVFSAAAWGHAPDSPVLVAVSLSFVLAYIGLGVASAGFVRAMVPEGDREGLLDGAIVMTAVAIGLWGVILLGGPGSVTTTAAERIEQVVSTLVPAWVMAMCVRAVFVAGRRLPSAVLLCIAGAAGLLGNALYLYGNARGTYAAGDPLDALWFLAFGAAAASALHPSMVAMTVPSVNRHRALPLARITLLAGCLLAAPVALKAAGGLAWTSVPFLGGLLLSALVAGRVVAVVADQGRDRLALRLLADRQSAIGGLGEDALAGLSSTVLEARASELLRRHLPARSVRLLDTGAALEDPQALEVQLGGVMAGRRLVAVPPEGRRFTAEDIAFAHAVANLLAMAAGRRADEQDMRHRALHDPLTGLPNRTLIIDRIEMALHRLERRADGVVGVLFVDLDGFKAVNDTLGHAAGDELLTEVARRIATALRAEDTLSRLAGDEFVACVECGDADAAMGLAERIRAALAAPMTVADDNAVALDASVGVALAQDVGVAAEQLLQHADVAMYEAKGRGGGRSVLFDDVLRGRLERRRAIERDLTGAVERGELGLCFQPILDLRDDRVVAAEALLRWRRPDGELVSPGEFVPIAEASGHIVRLGHWVLAEACATLATIQHQLDPEQPFTLLVNLSPVQLADPRLYERLSSILDETGAQPDRLGIEITESAVLDVDDDVLAMMLALRHLGVRIALDDFGTGYSSLSHLKQVPLDLLKVDASFVDGLGDRRSDRAIVAAVAGLAQELGVTVLAEGVETHEQLDAVRSLGCDLGQGYLLGVPDDRPALLRRLGLEDAETPPRGGSTGGEAVGASVGRR